MGGHDHGHEVKVPDWRIYKVEDVPQLKAVQDALETQGLRNPWLRNEVWKYIGPFEHDHPPLKRVGRFLARGFKWGLAAAIVTTILENTFFPKHHAEHHGDEHGGEHH